jgi:hypothetical protein
MLFEGIHTGGDILIQGEQPSEVERFETDIGVDEQQVGCLFVREELCDQRIARAGDERIPGERFDGDGEAGGLAVYHGVYDAVEITQRYNRPIAGRRQKDMSHAPLSRRPLIEA